MTLIHCEILDINSWHVDYYFIVDLVHDIIYHACVID